MVGHRHGPPPLLHALPCCAELLETSRQTPRARTEYWLPARARRRLARRPTPPRDARLLARFESAPRPAQRGRLARGALSPRSTRAMLRAVDGFAARSEATALRPAPPLGCIHRLAGRPELCEREAGLHLRSGLTRRSPPDDCPSGVHSLCTGTRNGTQGDVGPSDMWWSTALRGRT